MTAGSSADADKKIANKGLLSLWGKARPVAGDNLLALSIERLEETRERFARAYGDHTDARVMNCVIGEGTLADILAFAKA